MHICVSRISTYVPVPVAVGLDETTDNGTDRRATDGRENDERDRVLLVVLFPHVRDLVTIGERGQ